MKINGLHDHQQKALQECLEDERVCVEWVEEPHKIDLPDHIRFPHMFGNVLPVAEES